MTGHRRPAARDLLTDGPRTTPMWMPRPTRQPRDRARIVALLVFAAALAAAGVAWALVIAAAVP